MKALERYQKAGWTLKLCAKICIYMDMVNFPGEIQFYQII